MTSIFDSETFSSSVRRIPVDVVVFLNDEILPTESTDDVLRRLLHLRPVGEHQPTPGKGREGGRIMKISETVSRIIESARQPGDTNDDALRRLLHIPLQPRRERFGVSTTARISPAVAHIVALRQRPGETWGDTLRRLLKG